MKRVPSDLREIISLQQFAERYLSHNTTHLPHDSIALWQDALQRSTDVFILNESPQGEHVEKVPCRGTARDAVVLLFTWHGVGHYELITYNNVICLPRQHPFILHLDELHGRYITGLTKEVKRAARIGVKRTAAEREADVEVEDEGAISAVASTETSPITDHQHLCGLELRLPLEEKTAEIDNLNRLNAQLAHQLQALQRQNRDSERLPQPEDSPTTERELKQSAAFMHRFLSITVPSTPQRAPQRAPQRDVLILHPSPSLEVPPTPADPCPICKIASSDITLLPCKHRCCQVCWTREKKERLRMNKRKRRLSRELDLPIDPLEFLCSLCRQVVKPNDVEPDKQVKPIDGAQNFPHIDVYFP